MRQKSDWATKFSSSGKNRSPWYLNAFAAITERGNWPDCLAPWSFGKLRLAWDQNLAAFPYQLGTKSTRIESLLNLTNYTQITLSPKVIGLAMGWAVSSETQGSLFPCLNSQTALFLSFHRSRPGGPARAFYQPLFSCSWPDSLPTGFGDDRDSLVSAANFD